MTNDLRQIWSLLQLSESRRIFEEPSCYSHTQQSRGVHRHLCSSHSLWCKRGQTISNPIEVLLFMRIQPDSHFSLCYWPASNYEHLLSHLAAHCGRARISLQQTPGTGLCTVYGACLPSSIADCSDNPGVLVTTRLGVYNKLHKVCW